MEKKIYREGSGPHQVDNAYIALLGCGFTGKLLSVSLNEITLPPTWYSFGGGTLTISYDSQVTSLDYNAACMTQPVMLMVRNDCVVVYDGFVTSWKPIGDEPDRIVCGEMCIHRVSNIQEVYNFTMTQPEEK